MDKKGIRVVSVALFCIGLLLGCSSPEVRNQSSWSAAYGGCPCKFAKCEDTIADG